MQAEVSRTKGTRGSLSHGQRLAALGVLIVACVVSTAAHYTHNFVQIEHYPQSDLFPNVAVRIAIVIAWPLLTASGVFGSWLYVHRRYGAAYAFLAAYSLLGIATMGHFAFGSPHIPPLWYATIFSDAILGFAILAFAHWSAVISSHPAPPREAGV